MNVTMSTRWPRRLFATLAGAVLLALGACAEVKPFEYTEIHEIPPGPGLLTGDEGEFVLYED
ncbi:MAG: hypothetical protein V3T80_12110 [Kiloniellales bacterium]|jgi:hypothetical protein